ncbi:MULTISPECIES: ATP-dependent helicase [Pseudonocardia]|uniref:DNA 3'-5' helicase n=2 Tax=Pseudonocardia TaxID=1847 RepID=A0A1Y2N5R2_PSEAH|nr:MULTISPECIES: ATP-dependent DNA helicase [Pseudonocardia]OSY42499.1 ATP-dependent DNA helicase UvrD1 [Pseudonocardia autotrophica]TDN76018.1 superfamily I DNA/RNA helicase [Pseudonocardia autotrophica]BBF99994.1 DNA helicase [Pseudonocardia autotrophica]GEC25054.1 DNA helicase [Pseudonocardia saturnea]
MTRAAAEQASPRLVRTGPVAEPAREWTGAAARVLEHDRGPLRVLGGPGTGKTSLLLDAVVRRIRAGASPGSVLLLVGSRRAAEELRGRLTALLTSSGTDPGGNGPAGDFGARTTRELLVRTVHSYAFGVLRLHAARHEDPPPRLLASAEQDVVVRELLAGEIENWNGSVPGSGWPERLDPALGLPGFAAELRELLLRAAERGLGPQDLAELGRAHRRDEWVAAARFFRTYEEVTLLRGAAGRGAPQATAPALDSAELVAAALDALAADPGLRELERQRIRHLLIDDAQDLDPQQMELVAALAADAGSTLVAGDPDQAVLTFRGADARGLDAIDAPTELLTVDHRQTAEVRTAGLRLAEKLPGAGRTRVRHGPDDASGADARAAGREPADRPGPAVGERAPGPGPAAGQRAPGPGEAAGPASAGAGEAVQVRVFGSPSAEAGWIADRLRRAHLVDGVPWSEMAVLSRSARRTLPALRRALAAAGVPIVAPPDEVPLPRQPAVIPLLLVLRAASRPSSIDADLAISLLTSPFGGGDPMRMRRLRRGLLRLHAAAGNDVRVFPDDEDPEPGESDPATASSDPLLVAMLREAVGGRPDPLAMLSPAEAAPMRDVGRLLDTAARSITAGDSVEETLWRVWRRTGLARRWSEASGRGGPGGAAADRDLDAVLALFDAAARYTDRLPGADVGGFLEYLADQQLPGETLAPQAPRGGAVELLTAHGARGREWTVVAVPGVQEGLWPDLRLRGSLLGHEQLVDLVAGVADPGAAVSRTAPLLAEERRLFYVACTRARSMLLVSAVQGEDEQPSRFLDELDPRPADATEARQVHRPERSLVLPELVGELRRAVTAPDRGDPARAARRRRAATQLARLAADGVPGAHPDDWYGLADLSDLAPLRADGELVPISPSDVETIAGCPLRWVLSRHGGDESGALSAVTGSLVHALVQARAAGADPVELEQALQSAWRRLDAGAPWFGRRELTRVRQMLAAFDDWVRRSRAEGLGLVAVEQSMQLDLDGDLPPEGPGVEGDPPPAGDPLLEEVSSAGEGGGAARAARRVRLRGRVDRLERDDQGRPVVVDVKTGKTATSARATAEHHQLAVYQLAASLGAFDDVVGRGVEPGGARLLFLADRRAGGEAKEPRQAPLKPEEMGHWRDVLMRCADDSAGAVFVARAGPDCDRCPVRTSCPAVETGRTVVDG